MKLFNPLNARIAKNHLLAKRKQTIIASLGVTFGIAMFILMISVMTGVNQLLEETSLTSTPHLRIFNDIEAKRPSVLDAVNTNENDWNVVYHQKPKDESLHIKNSSQIIRAIQSDTRIMGFSPQLTSQVFFNYGPVQIPGVLVGVDISLEDKLYGISAKMKSGQMQGILASGDAVLMGSGLAKKMQVTTGDKIVITTPAGGTLSLRIAGIYQMGIGAIDNIRCYASLGTVQKILQKDSKYITDIHIKLKDLNKATELAPQYQMQFGYKCEDWQTANATILVSFTIRNIMTSVVVCTLLVVAGFGIYNIMNMTVYDKLRDIAILKATGFESRDIVGVFLSQAVFIGVLGASAGMSIGLLLSYLVSRAPFDGGEFLSIDHFPVNFDPRFYVFGLLFGVLTTILAGYFPARKASKVDPVTILRG